MSPNSPKTSSTDLYISQQIVPNKEVGVNLSNIKPSAITQAMWDPTETWNKVHGDSKSVISKAKKSTGKVAKFGTRTQKDSQGRYLAKVVVNDKEQRKFIVVAQAGAAEPTAKDVVDALKNDYGVTEAKTDKKGKAQKVHQITDESRDAEY